MSDIDDRLLYQLCSDLLPGHRHCRHGHVKDCPDPGECELIDFKRGASK